MAIFFEKLPREIRDKIYRLLLVDEVNAIRLDLSGSPKRLHPAILRACKQTYEEAISMLYEKNNFLFMRRTDLDVWSDRCDEASLRNCDPLKASFRRIKRVSCLDPNDASEPNHQYGMFSSRYIIRETHPMISWNTVRVNQEIRFITSATPAAHSKLFT